ncbi:DUF4411 family protein [Roseateles sp.]|uniref:DUF4411 family protein n=1 Tax=Roseateles sp. TaxID=1971397 RepID=UPI0039EB2EF5
MTYLLDANTLIEAKNRYYRMTVCPAYWSWVQRSHGAGLVSSIEPVGAELRRGNDELAEWAKNQAGLVTDRRNGATDVRHIGARNRWVERASRGGYAGVDFEGFCDAGFAPAAICFGARYDCPSSTRQ